MYEALVARVRYHIQKANFMGLKEAESTLLLGEAADAIEELGARLEAHNEWFAKADKKIEEYKAAYMDCPRCVFISEADEEGET